MPTLKKNFRFRMIPNAHQAKELARMAGSRRWVWNWALNQCRTYYQESKKNLSFGTLCARLTKLKENPDTAWLKSADSQALQQTLRDLKQAYSNYFEKRANLPKLKSKKRDSARFRIPQRVIVENQKVYVPKIGWIRIIQSMPVDLPTKSATFKQDATGKWFVTLVADFEMPDVALPKPEIETIVGVDVGLKDFVVLSNGERTAAPKFYRRSERVLRRAHRRLSRRKLGSNRRRKARIKLACVYRKIRNQRGDFLHKLSTSLVRRFSGVCLENLSLKGLAKTKLGKSFMDAAHGEFRRQIEYKAIWNRKHLAVIDRYFPSSRLHAACGEINASLTLSDRTWVCGCGALIDRDLNAACNIRDEGYRILVAGHAKS